MNSMPMRLGAVFFGLAVIAGLAGLAFTGGPGLVSANENRNANMTFTKWVTDTDHPVFPWDMQGIVGGDVGQGAYAGEVLTRVDDGTTTRIHALYHFNGKKHSFTADLEVTQTNATGAAVLSGVISDGWLKGNSVSGQFATLPSCDVPTPANIFGSLCFKGTLTIERGSKN